MNNLFDNDDFIDDDSFEEGVPAASKKASGKKSRTLVVILLVAFVICIVGIIVKFPSGSSEPSMNVSADAERDDFDELLQDNPVYTEEESNGSSVSVPEQEIKIEDSCIEENKENGADKISVEPETVSQNDTTPEPIVYQPTTAIRETSVNDIANNLMIQIRSQLYSVPFVYSSLPSDTLLVSIDSAPAKNAPIALPGGMYHIFVIEIDGNVYTLKAYSEQDCTVMGSTIVGISENISTNNISHIFTCNGMFTGMDAANIPSADNMVYNSFSNLTEYYYGQYGGYGERAFLLLTSDGEKVTSLEAFKNY